VLPVEPREGGRKGDFRRKGRGAKKFGFECVCVEWMVVYVE
jgi:hypothetical protein